MARRATRRLAPLRPGRPRGRPRSPRGLPAHPRPLRHGRRPRSPRDAAALAGVGYSVTAHAKDIFHVDNAPHLATRLRQASTVVTVSHYNVAPPAHGAARQPRCGTCPNGLPMPEPPIEPQAGGPVLCVARLVPKKGIDLLVRADGPLDATHRPLEIIGDGPCRADLEALAAELGIADRVRLPRCRSPQRRSTWPTAGARCWRSPAASTPTAIATACPPCWSRRWPARLPVVSTDVVGLDELVTDGVDGRAGRRPRTPRARRRDRRAARRPARRRRMGAGRPRDRVIGEFAPAHATAALLHVFDEALDAMRITVLCTDLGVRVPGDKGASMHLQSITEPSPPSATRCSWWASPGTATRPRAWRRRPPAAPPRPRRGPAARAQQARVRRSASSTRWATRVRDFAPARGLRAALAVRRRRHPHRRDDARRPPRARGERAAAEEEAQWRGLHLTDDAVGIEQRVLDHHRPRRRRERRGGRQDPFRRPARPLRRGRERCRSRAVPRAPPDAAPLAGHSACRPRRPSSASSALSVRGTASTSPSRPSPRTPHLHLAVVGDGPVRPDLERLAERLGVVHRVHFLGQCDHTAVATALAAADAAVAPVPGARDVLVLPTEAVRVPGRRGAGGRERDRADPASPRRRPVGHAGARPATLLRWPRRSSTPPLRPMRWHRAAAGREHTLAHHGWSDRARRIVDEVEVSRALA